LLHKRERSQRDRIVFNGHDLSQYLMCRVHRPIMAPTKPTFEHISGRHGEIFESTYRDGYDLPVEAVLRSEWRREVSEARHRLAEMLWTDEPAPLYLPDEPTLYLMAIVSGDTDLGEITDKCPEATITFHIGDPDYYGQRRSMTISSGGTRVINAGGSRPTRATVTAKPGKCTSWTITDVDTGEYVRLSGSFTSATTITLDMEREHATVNGSTAAVDVASDYFDLSGITHLTISSGTAKIEWVERWL
jgi:predicted phage tail component-like protein